MGRQPQRRTRGKPNETDHHVGIRIRQRRRLLGMSQSRLGEAMNVTFQQVQKYEHGANRVGAGRLYQLSQVLEVPVAYFFEGLAPTGRAEAALGDGGEDAQHSAEGLKLLQSYATIDDPALRRHIGELINALVATRAG